MILIVDDKKENIIPLKKILELNNFKVDFAESGEEALKKLLKIKYSLIILDVQMPGMDGFEVANAISGYSKSKDTPIIFLSAVNKEKQFIAKGYEAGGMDYITKPVDPDILLLKVKTFHRLYEQKEELKEMHSLLSKEIEIRKKAEEDLTSQMHDLESVLKSLPQIAFIIGKDGIIEYVNEYWYHYSKNKNEFPEIHPDDKAVFNQWQAKLNTEVEFVGEIRLRQSGTNQYTYFLMKVVPIFNNNSIVRWIGTLTDIQQQKSISKMLELKVVERTKELVDKNEKLEFGNHELQQFAWVVSHDLKEPLRKIQTFNKIIKERYLKENEEAVQYLNKSINASERMTLLISDLLDYSRLSASEVFKQASLNDILNEVLSDLDYLIEETKAAVIKSDLPVISCIPSQIRQVFQNILTNAIKFSKKDVPSVINITSERISKKEFDSKESATGKFYRITIKDNGVGFDEIHLDKIFTIFQRLNQYEANGTGIGLAIVKKIIEKHNGLITAKSEENKGAAFIIILPIQQD